MARLDLVDRRRLLHAMACGACGVSVSGWLPALAQEMAADPRRRRHCILLWMAGGPSQTDTFDMKPGHENGGEFKEIATNVPGVRFSEHLPQLAQHADKLAIIRSLNTKEGDHERGSYLMRTGQRPMSVINYPSVGAALAKELARPTTACRRTSASAPTAGRGRAVRARFSRAEVRAAGGGRRQHVWRRRPAPAADGYAELKVDAIKPPAGVTAGAGRAAARTVEGSGRRFPQPTTPARRRTRIARCTTTRCG